MTPGKRPASVTPSRKRSTMNDVSSVTNAKQEATMPQVIAMRASQKRAPKRFSSRFEGISKMA